MALRSPAGRTEHRDRAASRITEWAGRIFGGPDGETPLFHVPASLTPTPAAHAADGTAGLWRGGPLVPPSSWELVVVSMLQAANVMATHPVNRLGESTWHPARDFQVQHLRRSTPHWGPGGHGSDCDEQALLSEATVPGTCPALAFGPGDQENVCQKCAMKAWERRDIEPG